MELSLTKTPVSFTSWIKKETIYIEDPDGWTGARARPAIRTDILKDSKHKEKTTPCRLFTAAAGQGRRPKHNTTDPYPICRCHFRDKNQRYFCNISKHIDMSVIFKTRRKRYESVLH